MMSKRIENTYLSLIEKLEIEDGQIIRLQQAEGVIKDYIPYIRVSMCCVHPVREHIRPTKGGRGHGRARSFKADIFIAFIYCRRALELLSGNVYISICCCRCRGTRDWKQTMRAKPRVCVCVRVYTCAATVCGAMRSRRRCDKGSKPTELNSN